MIGVDIVIGGGVIGWMTVLHSTMPYLYPAFTRAEREEEEAERRQIRPMIKYLSQGSVLPVYDTRQGEVVTGWGQSSSVSYHETTRLAYYLKTHVNGRDMWVLTFPPNHSVRFSKVKPYAPKPFTSQSIQTPSASTFRLSPYMFRS